MLNAKVNIGERQTNVKDSVHLVFSFVNDSLYCWAMATMASREMWRICKVILGTSIEESRPCDPRHRWSAVSPYTRGRTIAACYIVLHSTSAVLPSVQDV